MDSGSDMILNLQTDYSYEKKTKPKPKPQQTKVNNTEDGISEKIKRSTGEAGSTSRKRKYIDAKDFVPISTLFDKNPEIPTVPETTTSSKTQKITFSSDALADLPINSRLKGNLKDQFHYSSLTRIQMLTIPHLLNDKDVMIKSPTGSGKTMCYALPIVDKLSAIDPPIQRSNGPYAVVLLPTRELALQTFDIFQELCKSSINIVPGMLIGGEKCKAEKSRLRKGINVLIATPGRLYYHLKETSCLELTNVCYLVLDEVDRLLDMGFKTSVTDIVKELDKRALGKRQTVLLSATLNTQITELVSITTKDPVVIDGTSNSEAGEKYKPDSKKSKSDTDFVLPSSLDQFYVFVPAKLRLVSLFTFLVNKSFGEKERNKVIAFMPNKSSVAFYGEMFSFVLKEFYTVGLKASKQVFQLHGDMKQQERFETFKNFKKSDHGVLFCTDIAARGLDIKKVDWILQFSCPLQIEDYLHKVGRTARIGLEGKSLMFLLPSESEYVSLLAKESIVLEEMKIDEMLKSSIHTVNEKKVKKDEDKATALQTFVEESVLKEKSYYNMAISAHSSFIQSYSCYPTLQKNIFHVKKLHLGHIAKSFGLREAPGAFKSKVPTKEESSHKKHDLKKKKKSIPKDGIFSGPRPGKMKTTGKKKLVKGNGYKNKKKLRV